MHRAWTVPPLDLGYIGDLTRALKVSPLVAQILVARGHTSADAAARFLSKKLTDLHDPESLPGVSMAADAIVAAMKEGRRITIYGDYDVDGVTATSLLWHALQLAGATVDYYIPSRLEEGYGLNQAALEQLHADDPRRLIVTVDCGITSVSEARRSRELGLDLIVTDHHHFEGELPDVMAVVHPRLNSDYPFGELCGAGVAFKLAWAICARLGDGKRASPRMREYLLSAIGLAAIGTVADVVPLIDENRVMVHFGLGSLVGRANPGLQALFQRTGLHERESLTAEDVGFSIAPRINAAGRLGQARLAVELLTTADAERAQALATYLEELNRNRQTVERRILKQAKELVAENPAWEQHRALVLAHPEWHPGVIGIVASRVAEQFQRPAILLSLAGPNGFAQGSGRSFAGCDLHAALTACGEHLETFGGHKAAAGLKIRPEAIDEFRESFAAWVSVNHEILPGEAKFEVDTEVRFADLTRNAVLEIDQLGPFGSHNRRPVLAASGVTLVGQPRRMGEGERHLSLMLRQQSTSLRAIAFGRGEWADELAALDGPFDVCFQPSINRFRGQESVQLQLMDFRPSAVPATTG